MASIINDFIGRAVSRALYVIGNLPSMNRYQAAVRGAALGMRDGESVEELVMGRWGAEAGRV